MPHSPHTRTPTARRKTTPGSHRMTNELPTATDRDVLITRVFAAPRSQVWDFWTRPELLAQWFGPDGFTVPLDSVEIDLRIGGVWNLSMQDDATGDRFPIHAVITELREEEYLEGRLSAQTSAGDVEDVILRVQFHDH